MSIKNFFIRNQDDPNPVIKYIIYTVLIITGITVFFGVLFYSPGYSLRWNTVWIYRKPFINGFFMTIMISSVSIVISTALGVLFGLAQRSRIYIIKVFAHFYIEVIRGTPLLVQILVFFYVVANAIGIENRYLAGIIIMSIFTGAYISEIVRGGIESVGKSQLETAKAIGLTNMQTYLYVIFPQVIRNILPPLTGQFASLIKDSSLLSIIAIKEFTMSAREINANTFSTFETYIPLAIGYLILTIPISYYTRQLERKYKYES